MKKNNPSCFSTSEWGLPSICQGGCAVLILFSLICADVKAESVNLSEKQALALFYQRNLDLLAARYNIENAQANEIIASAIPNPTLGFEILEMGHNMNQNFERYRLFTNFGRDRTKP